MINSKSRLIRDCGTTAQNWMVPRDGKVDGVREAITIREGFSLVRSDMRYTEDAELHHVGGSFLKIHCKVAGESLLSDGVHDYMPVNPGRLSVLVQPSDSPKSERASFDTHERSVTLVCTRDFAASVLPGSVSDLPETIEDFLRAREPRFSLLSLPLPVQMWGIVEDLLSATWSGSFRDLMIEARGLELLCLGLNKLVDAPADAIAVRTRHLKKVHDICAVLESDPGSNLSIAELCRLVAWNETQMMECFKKVTGMTISNYRHQLRMEMAFRRLVEGDDSVTEIAFDAGYEHPNNFATAFKRTYGFPPKQARVRSSEVAMPQLSGSAGLVAIQRADRFL